MVAKRAMPKTGGRRILIKAFLALLSLCSIALTHALAPQIQTALERGREGRRRIARRVVLAMSSAEGGSTSLLKSTSRLTSAAAKVAMNAAERLASENRWGVTIAVSDAYGVPILVCRTDDAFPASYEIAIGKARTAAMFRKSTGLLEDAANGSRSALLSAPFVLMRGGIPIIIRGECVGAVGVSGVTPDEDERVALAAADALTSMMSRI